MVVPWGRATRAAFHKVALGTPFFAIIMVDGLRKYAMFPLRLAITFVGVLISVSMIAFGKPWREEWASMNIRGYLLEGNNWNAAGF